MHKSGCKRRGKCYDAVVLRRRPEKQTESGARENMNKKLKKLARWSFLLAVVTFAVTFVFCHYVTPEGQFTAVFQEQAGKPMVTLWMGHLGTLFLFVSISSLLIARIFHSDKA